MDKVVLKLGSSHGQELRIKKDNLSARLQSTFKSSVMQWLKIRDEDWDSSVLNIATEANPKDCVCTLAPQLYDDIKSWRIDGIMPVTDIVSPMLVTLVRTPAVSGARRTPTCRGRSKSKPTASASRSGVSVVAGNDSNWDICKGAMMHVTFEMQKDIQSAGREWFKTNSNIVDFVAAPEGAFLQPKHVKGLEKLVAKVRLHTSCVFMLQ